MNKEVVCIVFAFPVPLNSGFCLQAVNARQFSHSLLLLSLLSKIFWDTGSNIPWKSVMLLKEDKEPCFHDQVVTMTESFAPIKVPNTMFFFSDSLRHFSFSPKFQKFQLEIKWNRPFCFGLTGIFGNTFEDGPLWPARSFQLVGPKCPLPFDKIVVCLQEQQPNVRRLGFDWVCATGMYPGFAQSWKVLEF